MAATFQSYSEFRSFYLREHGKSATRALHYFGGMASIAALISAAATQNRWWLLAVPVLGYGSAWLGHFLIEKNKPATFEAPLWSLISDYRTLLTILRFTLRQPRVDAG